MAGVALTNPKVQFLSSAGAPLVNGTVTVYLAGTTTPTDTWQDSSLSSLNTNPITLDNRGEATIWLDSDVSYKFVLKNAGGVSQWSVDNISGAAAGPLSGLTFVQSGTGAASRNAQDKMREVVSLADFGAVGDGSTDDTTDIQQALDSGAKIVRGVQGKTYLVGHTSTVSVNSTNQRYCLSIPTGVVLDLNGATLKAKGSSNSSPVMLASVTDSGIINGVIDCNKASQTSPATGEIAGIFAYNCTRPRIENIRAKNCRMYAGRFLKNTGGRYVNLHCEDSDADGWSFGVDGGYSGHVVDAFIDEIYAENCTTTYGGTYQGNPVIFTTKRCQVGRVLGKNSSGGVKIQDSSEDSSFDSLTFIGPTNGANNSGVKVQGNGAGLQPKRIRIGSIQSRDAYGNGLYVYDCLSVEIGRYHGLSNGTGGAASGSDQYDVNIDVPTGGRVFVGFIDSESPGTRIGRAQGAGICTIGRLYGKTPTGVGFSYNGSGEFYSDQIRIDDGGSAMTLAFQVTGGSKGRIGAVITNKAHSTTQSRVIIASGLYNWEIDSIILGSTDTLGGAVQLTDAGTTTAVTCGHVLKEYVGGAADYFQPIISLTPLRSTTNALLKNCVPVDAGTGTGFTINHSAAGANDWVLWKVIGWKVAANQSA
jgi:hypothetical protein